MKESLIQNYYRLDLPKLIWTLKVKFLESATGELAEQNANVDESGIVAMEQPYSKSLEIDSSCVSSILIVPLLWSCFEPFAY